MDTPEGLKPLDAGSAYGCPDCGDDLTPCPKCEATPEGDLAREVVRDSEAEDNRDCAWRFGRLYLLCLAKLSRLRQWVREQSARFDTLHLLHKAACKDLTDARVDRDALRGQLTGALFARDEQTKQIMRMSEENAALRVELAAARKQAEEVPRVVLIEQIGRIEDGREERAMAISDLRSESGAVIVQCGEVFTVERMAARNQMKVCDEHGGGTLGFVQRGQKVLRLAKAEPAESRACPAGKDCDLCMSERHDPMHPCGACTCGNEGTCEWCRMDEERA